jgi:hypothetical protein
VPAGLRSLERAAPKLAMPSTWGHLGLQANVNVWMDWCTALVLKISNSIRVKRSSVLTTSTRGASLTIHGMLVQITFRNVSARLEQKPLSLPDSALALAACDGSELTALDVVEQDDVGRDCYVYLVFIHFDIQTKSKSHPPTLRAPNRCGDRPCTAAVRSDHEIDEVNHEIRYNPIVFEHDHGPNRGESIQLTSMSYISTCRNPLPKNGKYVGFKPRNCARIPGVVLHVPTITPQVMRLEVSQLMSSSC